MPILSSLGQLLPDSPAAPEGFGFNGGFWDEASQAVGVCAGERGIHAARSHPNGFALAGGRAFIGPLTAHAILTGPGGRALGEILLNPRPLPRRRSCLIDPQAYAGPIELTAPAQIVRLDRESTAPLRFNSTVRLRAGEPALRTAAGRLEPAAPGSLLWIRPLKEGLAPPGSIRTGDLYALQLTLGPVKGEVRLATCAGPRLLKNGRIAVALAKNGGSPERTWRTVSGCDGGGRLVWVALLARGKDGLPGVTLREAAETLLELGAREGLNLDGGSSTCVYSSRIGPELLALFPLALPIHHGLLLRGKIDVAPLKP